MRTIFASGMAVLFLLGLLGPAAQAKTPLLLQHQGRLLDSGDQPVTGTVNLRFSIYDTQIGGSLLWTELHVGVQVTDGLFSANLGSLTPLSEDMLTATSVFPEPQVERYLEIQVNAGAPISPRLRLVAAPYAVASSRVSGDIQTSPGAIAIADVNQDGRIDMMTSPDSTKAEWLQDDTPDGENCLRLKIIDASSMLNLNHKDAISSIACTQDSVVEHHKVGVSGSNKAELVDAISSDAVRSSMAIDSDDDGNPEVSSSTFIVEELEFAVERVERLDANDDGVPESSWEQSCRSGGTTMKAIQTKGTGAIASVKMEASDSTGIIAVSDLDGDGNPEALTSTFIVEEVAFVVEKVERASRIDANDDGIPESSIEETCRSGGTTLKAIQTKGTGAIASVRMEASDSTGIIAVSDLDGDGNPEASMRGTLTGVAPGSSNRSAQYLDVDNDDDGIPESSVQLESRPGGTTMKAIQTKGTGAIAMVRMDASDSAGVTAISDIDGDGHSDAKFQIQARDQYGNMMLEVDTDDNGVSDNSLVSTCDAAGVKLVLDRDSGRSKASMEMEETRSMLKSHFETSDMLVHSNVVVETDSSGSNLSLSRSSDGGNHTDGWNVLAIQGKNQLTADIDEDDDGHTEAEFKTQVIVGDIGFVDTRMSVDSDDDGVADVSADMEVSADSANFRLNGLPPGSPVTQMISMTASPSGVHMAVGSATCDGTNWVNASDRNAKENFEKVDGEDILEKISGLEITKWNYKGDDDAQHIGPTAQDFKKTFGVGADDKSISTIDPSGIALAAIKELYAQVSELQKRDKEQSAQLQQRNAQLVALQGELNKLRAEIKKTK